MITLAANVAAIALYLSASLFLIGLLMRKQPTNNPWAFTFALCALVFHGIGIQGTLFSAQGVHFGFFSVSSLIFWVINLLVLLSSTRKPLHNLFVLLFPMSAISVTCALIYPGSGIPKSSINSEIASHILLSVLAYSLLTIASLQALLLAYQNYQLKHKHPTGAVRMLPPLQTMEALLFELLWAGAFLLTLSIITGIVFLEDIFAQHLAHKTVFTLISWVIYATLLWGRHQLGWRGTTAIRWTLVGFVALMLAYFGSKLVLELILGIS